MATCCAVQTGTSRPAGALRVAREGGCVAATAGTEKSDTGKTAAVMASSHRVFDLSCIGCPFLGCGPCPKELWLREESPKAAGPVVSPRCRSRVGSQCGRWRRGARWCNAVAALPLAPGDSLHQPAWRQRSAPSPGATARMVAEQRALATHGAGTPAAHCGYHLRLPGGSGHCLTCPPGPVPVSDDIRSVMRSTRSP